MLTDVQLKKIMPNAGSGRRAAALPILNAVAKAYEINNERRMAAWLATLAVESGELKYQEEIASGAAYEGRKDLGNTQKGDGRRFKGRGRIQITGRTNTTAYTNYLKKSKHLPFVDFTVNPDRLAQEPYATDSAGWFWAVYAKLNKYADAGDFLTTQIRVNGRNKKTGLPNHWKERSNYYARALSALPDDFSLTDSPVAVQPSLDSEQVNPLNDQQRPVENPSAEQPANTTFTETVTTETGTPPGEVVTKTEQTTTETNDKVVIEKEPVPPGFLEGIKLKIAGWLSSIGGIEGMRQYTADAQAFGMTGNEFFQKILVALVIAFLLWIVFRGIKHIWTMIARRWLTTTLIAANSTPGPSVTVANTEVLQEYKAKGYTVITR